MCRLAVTRHKFFQVPVSIEKRWVQEARRED
jgi:hypothetical protein